MPTETSCITIHCTSISNSDKSIRYVGYDTNFFITSLTKPKEYAINVNQALTFQHNVLLVGTNKTVDYHSSSSSSSAHARPP